MCCTLCSLLSICLPLTLALFAWAQVDPMSKEQDEQLRKWTDKTPALAFVKGGAKPGTANSGKGKKDKDGKKGKKK